MRRIIFTFLTGFILSSLSFGQSLPVSNIYLLQTHWADTVLLFKKPQFLTGFNKSGYNNQPAFINNSELLITVGMAQDNQTDIYLLDLEKKTRLRMTRTPESEYSAHLSPDNLFFSVVRVETDEGRSQRLWEYPLDRADSGKAVFQYLRGIGYYHWLDRFKVALFNVATTNYLSLGDTRNQNTQHLATNIGRTFQTSPSGNLVFVHKITDNNWVIKIMDPNTLQVQEITKTISGSEDFVVLKDGSILMGKGSRLYRYKPVKGGQWMEVADLKNLSIYNITRMAVSGDGKLAIVNSFE